MNLGADPEPTRVLDTVATLDLQHSLTADSREVWHERQPQRLHIIPMDTFAMRCFGCPGWHCSDTGATKTITYLKIGLFSPVLQTPSLGLASSTPPPNYSTRHILETDKISQPPPVGIRRGCLWSARLGLIAPDVVA